MVFLLIGLFLATDPAVPQFPITDIQVVGARWVSSDLIRSESGLILGNTYTEKDLSLARSRIGRLPFVLDADFTLEKGKQRGTYKLVVHIREHRLLFHHYDYRSRDRDLPDPAPFRGPGSAEDVSEDHFASWGLGARWFTSAYGFIYGAASLEQTEAKLDLAPGEPLDLGYSHYNFLGTGLFLNVNLQIRDSLTETIYDPFAGASSLVTEDRSPAITLNLAQPLFNRSQWISLTLDHFKNELTFENPNETFDEKWFRGGLSWYLDTTDNLALPTRGRRLETGLDYGRVTSQFPVFLDHAAEFRPDYERFTVEAMDARVEFLQHHPFTDRWSGHVSGLIRVRLDEKGTFIRNPGQTLYKTRAGINLKLWGMDRPDGDLRLESYGLAERRDDDFGREDTFTVHAGLVFRNSWGLMRVGFRWQKLDSTFKVQESPEK